MVPFDLRPTLTWFLGKLSHKIGYSPNWVNLNAVLYCIILITIWCLILQKILPFICSGEIWSQNLMLIKLHCYMSFTILALIPSNWVEFATGVHCYKLVTVLTLFFDIYFSYSFLQVSFISKFLFSKSTKIYNRGLF